MALEEVEVNSAKVNFHDIVLSQMQKVIDFCNVEFRGGFYTVMTTKTGEEKMVYVPDTREIFCNGCFALAVLLQPRFTDEMRGDFKEIREKLDVLTQEFLDSTTIDEDVVLGESFYDNEKDKILLDTYKNKKLLLHLKLFARLSAELKRRNYFEMIAATYEE